MKNITLAIDEQLRKEVRKYAAEHDTSVNAVVLEKLSEVVAPKKRIADAIKRMEEIADEGATTLYSDDLSHGQAYGPVTVINPFRTL